ncbi:uncharacterized protein LOC143905657 isoform X3 [Temnothorax americanus]|uniref:uncharacterized protein LOC143905657 isoform X3 n=1 Tax=Temnothorax americanus TaxID=1964332 RepID=UPI004067BD8F
MIPKYVKTKLINKVENGNVVPDTGMDVIIPQPRLRWTGDEKKAVLQAFAQHMANHTLPSLREIQETKINYPCLANRTSPQIKTWLHYKQKSMKRSPYGKTKRLRWTDDEKEAVLQAFAQNMANHTLPSLKEIQETRKNYPCLANRTSPQIKTWLHYKQKSLPKL